MSRAALTTARAYVGAIVPTLPHHREEHARVMAALDAALAAPVAHQMLLAVQTACENLPSPGTPEYRPWMRNLFREFRRAVDRQEDEPCSAPAD
jgi:hypothetical protein